MKPDAILAAYDLAIRPDGLVVPLSDTGRRWSRLYPTTVGAAGSVGRGLTVASMRAQGLAVAVEEEVA